MDKNGQSEGKYSVYFLYNASVCYDNKIININPYNCSKCMAKIFDYEVSFFYTFLLYYVSVKIQVNLSLNSYSVSSVYLHDNDCIFYYT